MMLRIPPISRRISAELMAKLEGRTQIQPFSHSPRVIDIKKTEGKTELVYHDPTFKPSVYSQPSHIITTFIIKPCILFRNSFKIESIEEKVQSGAGILWPEPKEWKPEKPLTGRASGAHWLRYILESLE